MENHSQEAADRGDIKGGYFCITDINWDTEDIRDNDLPIELIIPKQELLYKDEAGRFIPDEELKDRVADYLSDNYGWCVISFSIKEDQAC